MRGGVRGLVAVPCYVGGGWEEPRIHETRIVPTPQSVFLKDLLAGFCALPPPPPKARMGGGFPILTFRAPMPHEGESLVHGIAMRWHKWDVRAAPAARHWHDSLTPRRSLAASSSSR